MGDLREVRRVYNETWEWSAAGDEWSRWWGGTPALWFGGILPRIHAYVPTGTILELAPGHGRWSQYLKDLCDRLVLVDLAERCIEHCRRRFASSTNISYHVNDGRTLDMVADGSVDFAFSWDSLVHVQADVMADYLAQLSTKLAPDGIAFLHHSNAGQHRRAHALSMRTPERLRRRLVRRGLLLDVYAWRDPSVTAAGVRETAERAGLSCIGQEVFDWEHGPFLTEAVSLLARPGSRWDRTPRLVRTRSFRRDARRMAQLYAAGGALSV